MQPMSAQVIDLEDDLSNPQVIGTGVVVLILAWQALFIGTCLYQCCWGSKARMTSREVTEAPWTSSWTDSCQSQREDRGRHSRTTGVQRKKKGNLTTNVRPENMREREPTGRGATRIIMEEMYARAAPVLQDMRRVQNDADLRRARGEQWENFPNDIHGINFSRSSRTPRNPPSRAS